MTQDKKETRYRNHRYLNSDGSVDGERLLELLRSSPGGFDVLATRVLVEEGLVAPEYEYILERVVSGLCDLAFLASLGDEVAINQMKVAEKITYPAKYGLTATVIKKLADQHHTRERIARAMELRAIMGNLAWVVVPAEGELCDVNQRVKLINPPPKNQERIYQAAEKHWKPGTTLQALAMKIYLEKLQSEGVLDNEEIDEGTLKKDLRAARKWEAAHLNDSHWLFRSLNKKPIRVFEFSEHWKEKRRAKNVRKEGGKKSRKLP